MRHSLVCVAPESMNCWVHSFCCVMRSVSVFGFYATFICVLHVNWCGFARNVSVVFWCAVWVLEDRFDKVLTVTASSTVNMWHGASWILLLECMISVSVIPEKLCFEMRSSCKQWWFDLCSCRPHIDEAFAKIVSELHWLWTAVNASVSDCFWVWLGMQLRGLCVVVSNVFWHG